MRRLGIGCVVVAVVAACAGCAGKLKDRIASLEVENAMLASEKTDLEARVEGLEAKIAELEQQIAVIAAYQTTLEDELDALGVDRQKLAAEYEEAKTGLESAQSDLAKMNAALDVTRQKLEASQAELDAALGEIEDKIAVIDEMKKKQKAALERLATLKDLLSQFKGLIESGKLSIKVSKNRMVIEMQSEILFEPGSDKLSASGKEALLEVANVLKTMAGRDFQIAGHTDDAPKKKMKFASNWELSSARAIAVLAFLVDSGMAAGSLSAAGYGEFQPIADNSTEEGKAKNRRIEIVLLPRFDELPDLTQLEGELGK